MFWFKKQKSKEWEQEQERKQGFSSFDDCLLYLIKCNDKEFNNIIRWIMNCREKGN